MTFVITQNCCNDASCVPVCPVDCIRPVPGADGVSSSMLYIDPASCVDCGACMSECPVGAIYFEDDLPEGQQVFLDINADYFARNPLRVRPGGTADAPGSVEAGALRVAIVGSGPAACYAATELARVDGVEVNLFERLPTPFGLIRAGVAPDHQRTKDVVKVFEPALHSDAVRCYFNVAVGRDVTHRELLDHHHAVIYGVGASASRTLGIPGEELPGNHAASDVVAWYNGHPDHVHDDIDLTSQRAVIIGNGNVALDVARILVGDMAALAKTDIADHALQQLANSAVTEVVVLARRGIADAAFSIGEFLALGELPGVDVLIEGELGARPADDFEGALKYDTAERYSSRPVTPGNKRIVFLFGTTPVEVVGDQRVQGIRVRQTAASDTDAERIIEASLVLRSIGYRGAPIDGLPFDDANGVVPNTNGRVRDGDAVLSGVYVSGWIKRGARGIIGTNRTCAQETVQKLLADFALGKLDAPVAARSGIDALLAARGITPIDWQGWQRIDTAERSRGAQSSRPRVKFADVAELVGSALA